MSWMIGAAAVGRGPRRLSLAGLLALASLCASGSGVCAQQRDSILKQAAKIAGFATDVGPPADFVVKSRPSGDLDYIPVFQPPPEPGRPLLKSNELKAVKSGLDGVEKRDDRIRRAFPPAAKALEEQATQGKPPSNAAPVRQ